jgi:hypothetical protein
VLAGVYSEGEKKGQPDDKEQSDTEESAEGLQDEQDREGWKAGNLMEFGEDKDDFGYQRPTSDLSYLPSPGWVSDGGGGEEEEVDNEDEIGTFGLPDF